MNLYSHPCASAWAITISMMAMPLLMDITVFLFIVILGMTGDATVTPTSEIVSRRFGPESLGFLFGITFVGHQIGDQFEYIFIDCPPSLGLLTLNALTAASTVLVPIQCEYYALEGLSQLLHTISLVQSRLNPSLEMEGVIFTMYDARTRLSMEVVENVRENLDQNIYDTIVPRNIRLAEAPSHGMPITAYAPKSPGAISYRLLAMEVISRNK